MQRRGSSKQGQAGDIFKRNTIVDRNRGRRHGGILGSWGIAPSRSCDVALDPIQIGAQTKKLSRKKAKSVSDS